jgi:uncharacterized protein (DUF1800 family)
MDRRISRQYLRILTALVLALGLSIGIAGQGDTDPDPNSPTPVLLTKDDSIRALAHPADAKPKGSLSKVADRAFLPETKIELYVANLDLMEGEGANAFRVYGVDAKGRMYRFPVVAIERAPMDTYSVTVLLKDDVGYWEDMPADGDMFVYLTWRGLASNRVKLGLGDMGGNLKGNASDRPAPFGLAKDKAKLKAYTAANAPEYVGYRFAGDRMRFLEQASFGPTKAMDDRIRRIGLRTWLAEQFEATYPSLNNPYPSQPLKPVNAPADCDNNTTVPDVPVTCFRDTYSMYQPQTWFFREAFYGDAQLKHRVAWALAQIWVTSGVDVQQGRHMVEYHKVLSNNAFGNYRNLMKQMTLNPTMGGYLDMAISTKTNPNENYAREIKQLFTIGLFMLNPDGTVQTDGNGAIPSYDQNVVNNLTKVFTGWQFCNVTLSCPNYVANSGILDYLDPMLLNTNNHDLTAKTLLSYPGSTTTNIAACPAPCTSVAERTAYANASMDQAIDNVFNHPNVGPYVSKVMIQHLVTSDPTPAYVGRVAAVFNNNGFNVRGDMKAVVKAILLDPEARGDVKTDPNYGKLREPVQLATNFARAFGVRSADGASQSDGNLVRGRSEFTNMAQIPFFAPTVFNFFPPDYVIPGTSSLGPEFAIMTTGTAIARANFFNRMVFQTVNPPSATTAPFPVTNPDSPNGTGFDFSDLQALSAADATGNLLLDELNRRMLHYTMTTQNRNTILPAVTSVAASDTMGRVRQAVYLVATSSQYQVQR